MWFIVCVVYVCVRACMRACVCVCVFVPNKVISKHGARLLRVFDEATL
jgi:type IV secretory pathway VirB3-like protein